MILYQDADSICKRYLDDELGINDVRQDVSRADFLATCLISYAEVRAALASAHRARRLQSNREYARITGDFQRDWRDYVKLPVTATLVRRAGELAEKHGLRGYDAVHLASVLVLSGGVPDAINISTWDRELRQAAGSEGLSLARGPTS